jgi:hypothetical protein
MGAKGEAEVARLGRRDTAFRLLSQLIPAMEARGYDTGAVKVPIYADYDKNIRLRLPEFRRRG